MQRISVKLFLFLYACWFSIDTQALATDRNQPIHIEADWAELDNQLRTTVYKGSVVITQGSMRISGETVTVHYDENDHLTKLIAEGKPAEFRQRPDGKQEDYQAQALRMEYQANRNLILLTGAAESWQGEDRVSADQIQYDTVNGRVQAESFKTAAGKRPKSDTRVRITIVPKRQCEGGECRQAGAESR